MNKVIIGFCAYSGDTALCEGNALVIINQKKIMKNFTVGLHAIELCKIPLVDLFQGLDMGEEFCLDEAAFTLFEEYAELSFFNISSHTGDKGIELYRISLGQMNVFSS